MHIHRLGVLLVLGYKFMSYLLQQESTIREYCPSPPRDKWEQHIVDAAFPALVMEENASDTAAMETCAAMNVVSTTPPTAAVAAAVVVPPLEDTGASPMTCTSTSKREEIRKRLREKERALAKMIAQRATHASCNSSIEEDSQGSPVEKIVTFGKEEADRREAIRVLSQTALQVSLKLKAQKEESNSLRGELERLSNCLNERTEQKSQLENDVRRLRGENKSAQQNLALMLKTLGEDKSMRDLAGDSADDKGIHLQNKLAAAYEEVVWTQKNALSKNEQLEHCEYQLLAQNQEIDDLKQELHSKTRRIVELEVDLEMHDDRFLSAIGELSTVKSVEATLTTAGGDNNSSPPDELVLDNTRGWQKDRQKLNFRGIMSWRKKRGKEPKSFGSLSVSEEMPPPSVADRFKADSKAIEARYRKERYQNKTEISQLQQENNEHLIKIVSLEKALQAVSVKQSSESAFETNVHPSGCQKCNEQAINALHSEFRPEGPPCQTRFWEERVERLESEKVLHTTTIEKLRTQIESMKVDAEREKRRAEQVAQHCLLECDAQELKLVALEQDLKEITLENGTHRPKHGLYVDAAAGLESKLLDAVSEVLKLRNTQELKDHKIAKLRSEVIKLRYARMLSEKAAKGVEFSSKEHAREACVASPPPTDEDSNPSAPTRRALPVPLAYLF